MKKTKEMVKSLPSGQIRLSADTRAINRIASAVFSTVARVLALIIRFHDGNIENVIGNFKPYSRLMSYPSQIFNFIYKVRT